MKTYAKENECVNAPAGPFTTFSHCACGYNIRNELISAAKSVGGDDPGAPQSRTLNTMGPDPIVFAVRGGVEGHLKRRGGRRNGNWHYNTVAKVAALVKGSISSSLSTTLSCDTEKCVLTSSIGGFDANIGVEFTFKRKTATWDIWRFHQDGFELSKEEFESPLKGWAEQ